MRFAILSIFSLHVFFFMTIPIEARSWVVFPNGSGDAPTLQAAIDSAAVADTVLAMPGLYRGIGNRDLTPGGLAISIISLAGAVQTTIDPEGVARAFVFSAGESPSTRVEGFTIKNGYSSGDGGAIQCLNASSPSIVACVFEDNHADDDGGAIACNGFSSPVIRNCSFRGSSSGAHGGAIILTNDCSPWITDCSIENSYSSKRGGAISMWSECAPQIQTTVFANNECGEFGGAVHIRNSSPTLTGCRLITNESVSDGGGLAIGIGASVTLSGCVFDSNVSGNRGGAMIVQVASSVNITGCTIYGNSVNGMGSAVYLISSTADIQNTVIAGQLGGQPVVCFDSTATALLACCDVYGNMSGDWVGCIAGQLGFNQNISEDPMFCDASEGDFDLRIMSPLIEPAGCGLIGSNGADCAVEFPTDIPGVGDAAPPGRLSALPNPFTNETLIRFSSPSGTDARLTIYDIAGRQLLERQLAPNARTFVWDGRDQRGAAVVPGIYFIRTQSGKETSTSKVSLVR